MIVINLPPPTAFRRESQPKIAFALSLPQFWRKCLCTEINKDLLLTGIFLHDIGKTLELNYRRSFDYSDAGKLIGHLVMGVEMVNERAAKIPGFPEELRLLVNHMVISHHGVLEYGSPKRPKTLEAFMVHQIDDLDAKINSFSLHMRKDAGLEGNWTSYHKMWDRFLYKSAWASQPDDAPHSDGEPTGAGLLTKSS